MERAYKVAFIMEQALGHITHAQNLRASAAGFRGIQPYWILPAYETGGLAGRIPVYRSNWTVRSGLRARRMLEQSRRRFGKPDALVFHTQVPAVLNLDWIRSFPTVVSLDATPRQIDRLGEFYNHPAGPGWLETWKWRRNLACFQAARQLVTWSGWARDGLVAEYAVSPEKITVIPPGVDTRRWAAQLFVQDRPGPVRILFVGGDLRRKGGLLLLQVFARLRAELFTARVKAAPEVELHMVTQSAVEPQPGVFVYNGLKPNQPELVELFQRSHIFCLPTSGDCLPMALAEAGAAGLPTISTRLAGIPEIVIDGQTGLLVPPDDVDALYAALCNLVTSPELRARFGAEAGDHIRQNYDAARNAGRLIDTILAMVSPEQAG